MNEPVAGNEFPVHGVRELPLLAWDHRALRFARVSHREHVARIVRIGHGILASPDTAKNQVTQWDLRPLLREGEIATQHTGDGFAVLFRDGRIETQRISLRGIRLPPQAHHRVAVAQKPRIPGIVLNIKISAVNQRKDPWPSAVRNFEQHGSVALARVLRTEGNKIGRDFNLAVLQVHRIAEVHDALVVRVCNGQREIHLAGNALVSSCLAKALSAQQVSARPHLNARDSRFKRNEGNDQDESNQQAGNAHAPQHSTRNCGTTFARSGLQGRVPWASTPFSRPRSRPCQAS